ncbi:lysylphosphatidylglycerol synthase transmembrane domain-containing protein [Acidocella aquatica]|nr:YbhN family protein [Acidocella aquatica]
MKQRALKYVPPVLGLIVLAGVVIGLRGALRRIGLGDVLAAVGATPRVEFIHALMLLAVSLCLMAGYDLPGILFARRRESVPRIGALHIAFTSFCAYALSHVLGAPALSAAAIRLRLYAQWRVPAAGIARIVAISGSMFTFGLLTLLGLLLLLDPVAMPLFGHAVPAWALRAVGAALVFAMALYVAAVGGRTSVVIFRQRLALPGPRLALLQVFYGCADISTACAILYVVLPDTPGLSYAHVLGVYLAAFAAGIFSGLPAGVGVFDSVLLLGLSVYLSPATALGAILLFRVLYFLAPACAAALCYAGNELWTNTRKRKS